MTATTRIAVDVLAELGVADGRIGGEMDFLAASYWDQIQQALPKLTLEPC